MRNALLLLCLVTGAAARAQAPDTSDVPVNEPVARELEPGDSLRLGLEDGRLQGLLLETSEHFLTLDAGLLGTQRTQVPLSAVLELSVRKRSPGYGALIGAGVGTLAGSLLGLYGCALAEGATTGECILFVGASSATIGLMAAGLGAALGLLIPRWERIYERVVDGPLVLPSQHAPEELLAELAERPAQQAFAQIGLFGSGILTLAEPADALGAGIRVEALAQLGSHIAVGPEVAFHYLPRALDGFPINEGLFSFGALMRAAPLPSVVTPSLLVGFSLHTAGQPATYSVGAALDWTPTKGTPLAFELRWHQFNVPWKDGRQLTLGAGTRFFW